MLPWAAVARFPDVTERFHMARISGANVQRVNFFDTPILQRLVQKPFVKLK
jgi:hypothetical protein